MIVRQQMFGALASLAVAGCATILGSPAPAAARPDRQIATVEVRVRLPFSGTVGAEVVRLGNTGTAATRQSVVTANGGSAWYGRSFHHTSARFPAFDGAGDGARAVVAVTNTAANDELTPGAARFAYGAAVRIQDPSSGTAFDNGNNVIQRGLYHQSAQFKLQIDHGHPSCRVAGDSGAVEVTSRVTVVPDTWYQVRCLRAVGASQDTVTISVREVADGAVWVRDRARGPIGFLRYDYATPLSVGGKLTDATHIESASDQFNGRIDDAFFNVG